MKNIFSLILVVLLSANSFFSQENTYIIPDDILPRWATEAEWKAFRENGFTTNQTRGIETPPPFDNLRAMAEWEEIQVLTMAWTSYPSVLKQIVAAAKEEVVVVILCENPSSTENYLMGNQGGGPLDNMDNVVLLEGDYDSIWMRDYAGNPVYGSEVDDLVMVDWIYNRPSRPNDDASPELIAEYLGLDLYCITEAPTDLVNTGGNFMSDGFGNAFASELILEENEPGNPYGVTAKTEGEIDDILEEYLGINNYIKMETLPYDNIHHIDMHIKLLDEETLLVGQFPDDESDGPQIQANIEYVLSNYTSKWGTPFKIVWMPMPSSPGGDFPDGTWGGPYYRTYTNSVFVNNTLIVPTYREEFDTTAIRIYEENLPGYNVVSIDCDNSPDVIIAASGAIHCITHSVGVEDPLLISHQPLNDTDDDQNDYVVEAYMNHRLGVVTGTLFWKTDIADDYQNVAMTEIGDNSWVGNIPAQSFGTTVYYYVEGIAADGKIQTRPMPAPEGYWEFDVLSELVIVEENNIAAFTDVYPNPAGGITVINTGFAQSVQGKLKLYDVLGKEIETIHEGTFQQGNQKFFFDASKYETGAYLLVLELPEQVISHRLMVK